MAKINAGAVKLDYKDGQLLYLLDLNAKEPLSSLGKKLRLSEEGVAYRIRRLQEQGVIRCFNTVVDISALGYVGGRFMIRLQHCDERKENEIVEYFNAKPNSFWVVRRGGEYDLGIGIWARDMHEFYGFQLDFMKKFRPYISKVYLGVYHEIRQFSRAYLSREPVRKKGEEISLWNGKPHEIDKTDYSILKFISNNARLPTVEVARRLSLTPMVVKHRVRKMERLGIIKGYKAVPDLSKIGYFWYKIELSLSDFSKREAISAFCSAHPNTVYSFHGLGIADFEFEVEVASAQELLDIIRALRAKFSDSIISISYYLYSKEDKLIYMP
ncbi:MAG: AsnC family transcriptional regulator [Candidatus Micrarchaeota archaeon]|nr:AsnC family transcriptional regulator [Candidatus Micrarchaeota archaeon]